MNGTTLKLVAAVMLENMVGYNQTVHMQCTFFSVEFLETLLTFQIISICDLTCNFYVYTYCIQYENVLYEWNA